MEEDTIKNKSDTDPIDNEPDQKRIEYLQARRDFRKLQIFTSRIKFFTKIALLYFLCYLLYNLVKLPQWYLDPNIFRVYPNQSLILEGNNILKPKMILSSLKNIELPYKPVYLIDTNDIEKALTKLPPVKKIYIRRFGLPARIKVVIEEKTPVLSIAPKSDVLPIAVFTKDSSIIGREYLPLNKSYKTYLILTYDDFYKWSSKHVKYLEYLAKTIESYSGENLLYIDIRNADDVYIQLKTVKIRLGELNSTLFKRIERISSVLPQAKNLKNDIEYIDLRWDNSTFIKLKGKDKHKSLN